LHAVDRQIITIGYNRNTHAVYFRLGDAPPWTAYWQPSDPKQVYIALSMRKIGWQFSFLRVRTSVRPFFS
jgi:hypothetical protein